MVTILGPLEPSGVKLPLFSHHVPAGFPSPAADHLEKRISLPAGCCGLAKGVAELLSDPSLKNLGRRAVRRSKQWQWT